MEVLEEIMEQLNIYPLWSMEVHGKFNTVLSINLNISYVQVM